MPQLVQRNGVVFALSGKLFFFRQYNLVSFGAVISVVTAVPYDRARRGQQFFGAFVVLPNGFGLFQLGQAVYLFCIEHGKTFEIWLFQSMAFFHRFAVFIKHGFTVLIFFDTLDVGNQPHQPDTAFPFPYLGIHGSGLFVSHPARVAAALQH